MILNDWLSIMRDALYGDAITAPDNIAIGTGTTPVTGIDTGLDTEILRDTCINGKVGDDITSFMTTWATTDGNLNAFTEAGAVNAASGGVFMNRKVFPAFNKTDQFELRVSIYVKSENNL